RTTAPCTRRAMRQVEPSVELIAKPSIDWEAMRTYIDEVGGNIWAERVEEADSPDAEDLLEFSGRMCYRSWEPGLNPKVSRVSTDAGLYLVNVLQSQTGTVLEHVIFTLVLHNVSRVLTHDLFLHCAGSVLQQESLHYVRLSDIPYWFQEWACVAFELM